MTNILFIFTEIILPIFILIGIGTLLQKKFKLDLYTLSKLNMYYLTPAIVFNKLSDSNLPLSLFGGVLLFSAALGGIMYILTVVVGRLTGINKRKRTALTHSVLFYNSANYGIPVNELVFRHDPFASSIQISVMIYQNILVYSYGVFSLNSLNKSWYKTIQEYFRMPLFYALVFGLVFNAFDVDLPSFIATPIEYVTNALIAIALLTLGCQIAEYIPNFRNVLMYVSLFMRLMLTPAVAFIVLKILQLDGTLAQALFISTAMPTAVNTSIIAQEYNNEPQFASQTVVISTLLSSLTLTFIIHIAMNMF